MMVRSTTRFDRIRGAYALIAVAALLFSARELSAQQDGETAKTGILKRPVGSGGTGGRGRGGGGRGRGAPRAGGYSLYVPTSYDAARAYPLILALPSSGSSDDAFIKRDDEAIPKLAEEHGYLIAVPAASRSNRRGMWTKSEVAGAQAAARAEEDGVLTVLAKVKEEFKVDPDRVYILGHSSGGAAAMFLASKHPELWAAVACIGGGWGDKESLASMKGIAVLTVIAEGDSTISVKRMRRLSDDLKSAGIENERIEIEGADSDSALALALPKVFDFFERQGK